SFDPPLSPFAKGSLLWNKLSSFVISSSFLVLVVLWATTARIITLIRRLLKGSTPHIYAWEDNSEHWKQEKVVKDIAYYAQHCGYDIKDEEVETQDGYFLRPKSDGRGGFPVLILHGLFQSSGSFVTSEERSLAFWLSEHGGYQ
ncbi:15351_t:CDS:2, partial [Acaulospora colombiana]